MVNKKIALALLLASLSCSANERDINIDDHLINPMQISFNALAKECRNLGSVLKEYINNYSIKDPDGARQKCVELAKILNKQSDYFISEKNRHSAVERKKFIEMQSHIINNVYRYEKNPRKALLEYATYLIADFLNTVNLSIDNDQSSLYLQQKGATSSLKEIYSFKKGLSDLIFKIF